jgi:hypothetical protein
MSTPVQTCVRWARRMPAESAGYSHRALIDKLGIKPGQRISIVEAPIGFPATLGELPAGVRRARELRGSIDLIVFFALDAARLARRIAALKRVLAPAGMLWLCWPKKSSAIESDLDDSVVRGIGLAAGLVDVKVCAVDENWSGLKFVYRLRDRPKPVKPRRARRTK